MARQDTRDLLVLYGRTGEPGETVLRYASQPTVTVLAGTVSAARSASGQLDLDYTHSALAAGPDHRRRPRSADCCLIATADHRRHDVAPGHRGRSGGRARPALVRTATVGRFDPGADRRHHRREQPRDLGARGDHRGELERCRDPGPPRPRRAACPRPASYPGPRRSRCPIFQRRPGGSPPSRPRRRPRSTTRRGPRPTRTTTDQHHASHRPASRCSPPTTTAFTTATSGIAAGSPAPPRRCAALRRRRRRDCSRPGSTACTSARTCSPPAPPRRRPPAPPRLPFPTALRTTGAHVLSVMVRNGSHNEDGGVNDAPEGRPRLDLGHDHLARRRSP